MARYAAGVKTTAGSTILPMASLFSSVAGQVSLREIGVSNTTTTAFDVKLARISSGPGTVGASVTRTALDNPGMTPQGMAFTTHTAGTPTLTDLGYRMSVGAAIGAGGIFTFGAEGIEVLAAAGTANGICVIPENGLGQAAQVYFVWDE